MAPKPRRAKPVKAVARAIELLAGPKRPPPEPPVQRLKHEKLVKALRKLHPMD